MKKDHTRPVLVFALMLLSLFATAQTVTLPRTPSPAATVAQTIGISTVTVKYSRPSVKGRTIWGAQVPYGFNVEGGGTPNLAPWRAGANENTVITFSHDAKVEGHAVPAGSYGLFFAVNNDNTAELVLSKDNTSWGNYFYDPAHDLFRQKIQTKTGEHTELLTYEFSSVTRDGAELDLRWEKKVFPVKIEFAVDDIVLANAEAELHGVIGFGWQASAAAANYALVNNVNSEKAMQWIDHAIAQNKSFATLNTKAGLLRLAGKTAEADKISAEAMSMATEFELNNLGYQYIGQNQYDKAAEVLLIATQRAPKSANAWDSLGEAYFLKGDKKNAKMAFTKALSLNPPAATRTNSEKYLKQL